MVTGTAAGTTAMPSNTTSMDMDAGGGMGDCKISVSVAQLAFLHNMLQQSSGTRANSQSMQMLWNWNTVDSCFVSSSWHVTSKGMFAGSCIGVVLLVITLEFLRRAGKEYDRYICARHTLSPATPQPSVSSASSNIGSAGKGPNAAAAPACAHVANRTFRPTVLQQAIRALLHMLQFAVAYFIMLLAMYYNGYIIICIFIGAYLGYFIFGWETLQIKAGGMERMEENVTVCCG